ncbi:malonate decarboxylase holo-ACP synthase [Marinobacterium lutimaris]|uniref:Phosphoribosyl-dephospho-CoA transferase n=1 Tax=Marinobacterium lutimaris TaxID=568106 RepID=A0A1H5V4L4_9GAMM|nr:malonate decarboxylase holo-ACP synthase [Marinobacterium lutimaris]SEF81377.1 phosphoribosyl-dephospho-CoA transferase [Marinobacterium lutimaris]
MNCRAHDLIWIERGHLRAPLPGTELPDWVVSGSGPVVVRRANADYGWIPVGIRGKTKAERQAALAPINGIDKQVNPYSLADTKPWLNHAERDSHPVLMTLCRLATLLNGHLLRWGVTGSLGYEFATGEAQLHPESDLDLVIDAPNPISREQAATLIQMIGTTHCRVDIQLETPWGAIALAEWAGSSAQVLQKTNTGPRLTATPWADVRVSSDEGVKPC